MTVKELVALLAAEDQDATVGISMSFQNGWVAGIKSIKHAYGVVCLDQTEETLYEEEVHVR